MADREPSLPTALYLAAAFSVTLAAIGVDTELVGYTLSTGNKTSAPARRIRVKTAGNVQVRYPNGHIDTVPFAAGETQWMQVAAILAAGTTAADITIFW